MLYEVITIVLLAYFLTIGNQALFSQEIKATDSIHVSKDFFANVKDTVKTVQDTTKKDSIKPKKATLEGVVKRVAKDYEKFDQKKKQLTLYNEAEIYYTDRNNFV